MLLDFVIMSTLVEANCSLLGDDFLEPGLSVEDGETRCISSLLLLKDRRRSEDAQTALLSLSTPPIFEDRFSRKPRAVFIRRIPRKLPSSVFPSLFPRGVSVDLDLTPSFVLDLKADRVGAGFS